MRWSIPSNVWYAVALVMVVSLALTVYADVGEVVRVLGRYQWWLLPLAMGLTLTNQALRFVKWEYLLRELDIDVPLLGSLGVFTSALVMILTPGKLGDFWKSWLLRDDHGVPISRSSPVVAVERLTDLVGVICLALLGVYTFGRSVVLTVGLLGTLFVGVALLRHRPTCERLFDLLGRIPRVGDHVGSVRRTYENSYELLRADVLTVTIGLSVVSWFCECLGLWLILSGFGVDPGILASAFVFALSSILGALSLLPGGIGATEGSMTLLLVELDVSRSVAVGATLLTRAVTLWFSAGLALAALPSYYVYRRQMPGGSD
ncbi:flippase-like domain-containing protein [Salinirubellus salinus]|uniref:Flippase-like domain-containing protein n=1 Tax=Salinirubellus salinus TaxID=1364945 RepID=A0A9E7R411_9EURY|nr:lysylphosphatidylglycerol synthase transmembrane domain-containing protein [Salinirubellus salinus]UWM54368.1 flippase-like domain-containing protein [Salinirubellus salinus]